jgi:hypothetical protein
LPSAHVCERLQFSEKQISSTKVISNEKMIKLIRLAAHQEGFHIHQNATISTTQATQLYEATKAKIKHPAIHERTRRHESIGWKNVL